jgi:hypothetical protein
MPSGRWIVNFDIDLVDSIVLGTLLGAYCPFLVCQKKIFPIKITASFVLIRLNLIYNVCMFIQQVVNNIYKMH